MKTNILNLIMKLVNSGALALLTYVILSALFEILKRTIKLPDLNYAQYIQEVVVIVFIIAISTFRYDNEIQKKYIVEQPITKKEEMPMPAQVKAPEIAQVKSRNIDEEIDEIKRQMQ
jgi:hypothetical protein